MWLPNVTFGGIVWDTKLDLTLACCYIWTVTPYDDNHTWTSNSCPDLYPDNLSSHPVAVTLALRSPLVQSASSPSLYTTSFHPEKIPITGISLQVIMIGIFPCRLNDVDQEILLPSHFYSGRDEGMEFFRSAWDKCLLSLPTVDKKFCTIFQIISQTDNLSLMFVATCWMGVFLIIISINTDGNASLGALILILDHYTSVLRGKDRR